MNRILITGGAGFVGSHTASLLLEKGYDLIIIDSFVNTSKLFLKKIFTLFKKIDEQYLERIRFIECDIRDFNKLNTIFQNSANEGKPINSVIHFAGLKSVSESVENPLKYWDANVIGSINLFKIMAFHNCKTIVFSSSANIYGTSDNKLLKENSIIKPNNAYAETKVTIEKILKTIYESDKENWKIANLRYFNPIGAHESGLIGESPNGIPSNLFPFITQVAIGERSLLRVFGKDWPTKDGTAIRDFIHIMDLAEGHLSALKYLDSQDGIFTNFNLGTSIGTTVLELVRTFENVNKCKIPYKFVEKRAGDVAISIADNKKAISLLDWHPNRNIEDMCIDGWLWQQNIKGF
jgi:UDP-glucose 4-epimerase